MMSFAPAETDILDLSPSSGTTSTAVQPLSPQEVRVWLAPLPSPLADDASATAWQRLEDLLSEDELERSSRFQQDGARFSYIAAHALGRLMLSRATGEDPRFFRFEIGERGKPEVICAPGAARLRLNLSHTNGLVAAGLSMRRDIGVDVERLDRSPSMELVAKRVFSDAECAAIFAEKERDRLPVFLQFWTLKEAYVKAIGKGLAQPLKRISFQLGSEDKSPQVYFDGAIDPDCSWQFAQLRLTDNHILGVAVSRGEEPIAVGVRQVMLGV
ncbi:4'-phosphopantetheinyl transferase superfamily protein [Roseibium sp. CAU 1637]|uniref:4'-phosphopantetheinyl transferase superfamily protein n=1 Tax=Roseibium limicola TaxID=2816037 RepID=A0A939EM94_9HYPH|nr:4'-phosphopantetheinyl transferase superfamily protein [Roseibium limicola]MBO0345310.1 4'-phosphopantetheinyl transferase superfamily protein [Roseibium limicola]